MSADTWHWFVQRRYACSATVVGQILSATVDYVAVWCVPSAPHVSCIHQIQNKVFGIRRFTCRFQWSRCLRCRSTAARLLRSWVRIPPGAWIFVCCECCVLSGRGLCDELITSPRGVLPPVARRCVWSRKIVWRGGQEKRAEPLGRAVGQSRWAEPLGRACSKNQLSNLGQNKITS
jgi:hypothetical protein